MLAQTVRNNMTDIKSLKMRGKTTKFSNLFQSAPTVNAQRNEIRQVLMKGEHVELSEDDSLFDEIAIPEQTQEDDMEISEYIVENPDEVVVNFPIVSDIKLDEKLPFFRSISLKLASL